MNVHKITANLCALALCLCVFGGAIGGAIGCAKPLNGGWTTENGEMTEELQAIFDAAVADTPYATLSAKKVLGHQVVAGMNYKFACEDEEGTSYTLTVYHDLEGSASVTLCEPEYAPKMVGAWESADTEVTEEIQGYFDDAIRETEYADYVLEKVLGVQVVAGRNYRFACKDGEGNPQTLTVYVNLAGEASVLEPEG